MSAEAVGAIIQGIAQAGQNAIAGAGLANDRSQNIKNMRYQNRAQMLNLALQNMAWNREDTAVQRRVADLKAAGLSPVLAAGSAASTMAPIHIDPTRSDFRFGGKNFNFEGIAETINNALMTQANLKYLDEQTKKVEQQRRLDLISFPDKINKLRSAASNAWQDAATKTMDNAYYRVSGISPRSSSEVGRTTRDLSSMINEVINGLRTKLFGTEFQKK